MQILGVSNFSATTPRAFIQRGGATTYRRSQPISAVATAPPPNQNQIAHSMPPEKLEIFKSLEPWVIENVHPLLKSVEKCWQPDELLPDPTKPVDEFMDEVRALRERTKELPDEYFVVLVGDLVTEDGLPTYQSMLNNSDATRDETGSSPSPWAVWNRGWTADENRHGDLLRTYLYLSGRVDMSMIERTVQYLIGAGMNPGLENNPYLGYVYTSFQERATFVSHCNTALLAKEGGDPVLANICGLIAGDEKRHERAYVRIIGKLLEVDPNDAMLAIGKMFRSKIAMPAHLMYDGEDPHLFEHFAFVAHKLGVYTPNDYADIMEFLVGKWGLEKLEGLKGDGRRERDYVCGLAPRIKKLQARAEDRAQKDGFQKLKFSWIFNREV